MGVEMAWASASDGGHCPVRWLNQHALVELPERVDRSNAGQVCDDLLRVIDHQVLVLLADMTGTTTCDHACGDALARVFQQTMARGIGLRLITNVDSVRRVLTMCGLDRVVPVCGTVRAALAATAPTGTPPAPHPQAGTAAGLAGPRAPAGDTGGGVALPN